MIGHDLLLGYVSPDSALPLASALAGLVGVLLMCGRSGVRFLQKLPAYFANRLPARPAALAGHSTWKSSRK